MSDRLNAQMTEDVDKPKAAYADEGRSRNYGEVRATPTTQGATVGHAPESMLRFWLERRRDQHRIDADAIQTLLDMLPAKIPPGAESALQRLLFK